MHEVTEEELSNCISNFKNGKAPDESKITIEHFKYGGNLPVILLTKLVNLIFQNAAIIVCPSTQYRHWSIKSFIIYFQDWCIYGSHTTLSIY
jgi:hypothetical protein